MHKYHFVGMTEKIEHVEFNVLATNEQRAAKKAYLFAAGLNQNKIALGLRDKIILASLTIGRKDKVGG